MSNRFSRRKFVKFAGGVIAGSAAVGSAPLVNLLAANAQSSTGYKVVGYFENWSQYRQGGGKFLPAQIDPSLYTHINFAFGIFGYITKGIAPNNPRLTGDYRIQPIEWNDQTVLYPEIQKLKLKNPNLKTLLSIGGWGFNDPQDPIQIGTYTYNLFSQMAASAAGRQQFIYSALEYAQKYKFDGIDLDWEYPGYQGRGGRPEDFANFLALVREFRTAISGRNFLLTIASSAIVPSGVPDQYRSNPGSYFQWLAQCAQYLDWLNVMSYDYHGAFPDDKVTGMNAPLPQDSTPKGPFSVKNTIEAYLAAGIPNSKIVMGIPTYGRTFKVSSPLSLTDNGPGKSYSSVGPAGISTVTPGVLSYYEIQNRISSGSLTRRWHEPTLTPYAYNSQTSEWVSYDDTESIGYKTSYLIEKKLGGAMIWAIGLDQFQSGFPLIKRVKSILDNPALRPKLPSYFVSGGRRYNQYSFLCTHNSFANSDENWTAANQFNTITKQLNDGVRALMLDIYNAEFDSLLGGKGVYLLHNFNPNASFPGINYALPLKHLYDALNEVVAFLKNNRNEVVTIFLEDYVYPDTNKLKEELDKVTGLKELIYDPDNNPNWSVRVTGEWPLLSEMIEWNKRLIIFSDKNHNNLTTKIGVAYDRNYILQNFWSLGVGGTDWDCQSRWRDGYHYQIVPEGTPYSQWRYADPQLHPKVVEKKSALFLFNHFRDTPTRITAALDNTYDKIMDRIENRCCNSAFLPKEKTTKQLPNFVAVDFWQEPVLYNNKAANVVQELNRRWENKLGCANR
ncbi:glycosyl hydrolase family 18 protein [Nostoc punctiforme]|uniref:chitinase n=1 Tax=Nostoc punctiforme (strain ATCC 29133 / PCC 73102) TaxID=63737 RepID=B2JBT5_NOSP7|nr:glycosyl hydrolase family 18 protein [Nostoc punctiforme]ACC85389.1 glycoside hydrolase, family 18 [Nostoc punctiforme PCC 73102]